MSSASEFKYKFAVDIDYPIEREKRIDRATDRCYEPYFPDPLLVDAMNLAIDLERPLLLEGEPGCGKTQSASCLAYQLTRNNLPTGQWWPFYDWRVKSYTKARDGLYTFDGVQRLRDAQIAGVMMHSALGPRRRTKFEAKLQPKNYREFQALGKGLQEPGKRAVVLIDEVDKADSDFANDLLLELDEFRFEVPETGEKIPNSGQKPIIILTSNREKPLPDAFLRRCLYFRIKFPEEAELRRIARGRLENFRQSEEKLIGQAIEVLEKARNYMNQPGSRKPGTSEFLDFLGALRRPGIDVNEALVDLHNRLPLLGILLKTEEDQQLYVKKAQAAKKAEAQP
jgi:MoxR-like ATPase